MASSLFRLTAVASCLIHTVYTKAPKQLIIDTDIFSDVDDAAALLLASTLPHINLLVVQVNVPSSYSALAVSAILGHYGHADVPVGLRRPINNDHFFDSRGFELGEYASKIAYHWQGGSLRWDAVEEACEPVELYRKILAGENDGSVTIASIGFLENLSTLLNSTADTVSPLRGPELVKAKVAELVVMGGEYPFGHEFNFRGDDPSHAAHVINNWPGKITFSGYEMGKSVLSGSRLTVEGPLRDPVKMAYTWYSGYNASRMSWDPLTLLYAIRGLGQEFRYANSYGYNHVFPNGSNTWVFGEGSSDQHWLELKVDDSIAGAMLDELYLKGAWSVASSGTAVAEGAELGEL